MGNCYTYIEVDGRLICIDDDMTRVNVHRWRNAEKVEQLHKEGKTLDEIRMMICTWCNGFMPCGCSNPSPPEED